MILPLVLAAALAASCGMNDPMPVPVDKGSEMSFHAAVPATKGLVTGTDLEDDVTGERTLTISAFLHPQSGREENYFTGETFRKSDGRWRHDPAIYWPIAGELDFLAYSSDAPFGTSDTEWGTARWGLPNASERVTLAVGEDRTQDDILYGAIYHTSVPQDGRVALQMKHAQAWIEVQLSKNETVTSEVVVSAVELKNVYLAGDLSVTNNFGNPQATWNLRRATRRDAQVDDLLGRMGQPLPDAVASLGMLIPEQGMTSLYVEYSIGGVEKTWTKELDHGTWQAGKHYIYAISFDQPALGDLELTITEEPWNAGREFSSYGEILLGNMIYATGSSVDAIGDGFDLSESSKVYWRRSAGGDYVEVEHVGGTWNVTVDYEHEEWDINVMALAYGESNYNVTAQRNSLRTPLMMTVKEPGVLYLKKQAFEKSIEYSLNDGPWVTASFTNAGTPVALSVGDEIRFRGNNAMYYESSAVWCRFTTDGALRFDLSGNITSLIDSDDYKDVETISANGALAALFRDNDGVVSARDLLLTATTVSNACYQQMFQGCVNMTEAPKDILAANGAANVFSQMFSGCTNLATPPERIYGTAMGDHGAYRMFYNCKALTRCPDGLDDKTELRDFSFSEMFYGCSNLSENVPDELVALNVPSYGYNSMFNGTAITRAPEILAKTVTGKNSFDGMFFNCKSLVTPPSEIKVTEFHQNSCLSFFGNCSALTYTPVMTVNSVDGVGSFQGAFSGCTNLSTINIEWNATALSTSSCRNMFYNCDALTTAMPMEIISLGNTSCAGMYQDCDNLTSAPITFTATDYTGGSCCELMFYKTKLPAAIPMTVNTVSSCSHKEMYRDCKQMTTCADVTLNATSTMDRCYANMFDGCNSLVSAMDQIGATTFGYSVCSDMFKNCMALSRMPAFEIVEDTGNSCCQNMFLGCSSITENRAVFSCPAILKNAFYQMFANCSALVNAPDFVATSVGEGGCRWMYASCTALTNAPALPMMTLGSECYKQMFFRTYSLVTAPDLPATTPAYGCYEEMFNESGIVHGPSVMPLQTTAGRCCRRMFLNCKKMTSCFTDIPATEAAAACFSSMFQGCSALLAGPQLHLTKCADMLNISGGLTGCCHDMFSNCNSMVTGPTDFGEATPGTRCFYRMFYNCWALTTAPAKMSAESMKELCYYGMFFRCYALQTPPQLPSMLMANACYHEMFYDCYGLTSFPDLPATILAPSCYYSMFKFSNGNQARLTTAPDLPAATLEVNCYREMFCNQRTLNSARKSATNTTAANALGSWMAGVAASGTLTLSTGVTLPTGASGVPSGWTVVYE